MKPHFRTGWDWIKNHVHIWVLLFLYHLLWGFFLYRFIDSIVVPILKRYPDPAPSEMSNQIFMLESQFQLTKTSIYTPYLWAAIGFIALRMLLTPLIHAGLLYTMANHRSESSLTFFRGIATVWKPISLLYLIETVVLLAPSYWIVPYLAETLATSLNWQSMLMNVLPIAFVWIIGGWLLHHLFLFLQFGAATEMSLLQAMKWGIRRILPVIGISLIFILITALSGAMVTTAAMFWTGMTALILQQAFPALQTLLKLWSLSSRYAAWQHRENL
ncbi:carbamoyl transferase [Paenibacillus marinisediminis]